MNKVESFELDHRKVKAPYISFWNCCYAWVRTFISI